MSRRNPLSIPGIYGIVHTASGRMYIGRAVNIRKRWEIHRSTLASGQHRNRLLQTIWDKDGSAAFHLEVIADLSGTARESLVARLSEQELAALRRYPDNYNLMRASDSGLIASEETRQRLSLDRYARWANPEKRERIVSGMRKRAADPEHQKRRGAAIAAYHNQPEVKAATSARMTEMWADPEHRAEQSEKRKANWQNEAYQAQQAESRKAAWQDPEKRARRIAGLRAAWVRRKAGAAKAEPPTKS